MVTLYNVITLSHQPYQFTNDTFIVFLPLIYGSVDYLMVELVHATIKYVFAPLEVGPEFAPS